MVDLIITFLEAFVSGIWYMFLFLIVCFLFLMFGEVFIKYLKKAWVYIISEVSGLPVKEDP